MRAFIRTMINLGVHPDDNDFLRLGKQLFNADSLMAMIIPWLAIIPLGIYGLASPIVWKITIAITAIYGTLLLIQSRNHHRFALGLYVVICGVIAAFCVILMRAYFVAPFLLTSIALALISYIPTWVKTIYGICAGFVAWGILCMFMQPLGDPWQELEWVAIIRDYHLVNILIGFLFVVKIGFYIHLSTRFHRDLAKQSELAQINRDRYRSLFENALEAIAIVAGNTGVIIKANPRFHEMFRCGSSVSGNLRIEELIQLKPGARDTARTHQYGLGTRCDGSQFHLEFSESELQEGSQTDMVFSVRDVHEQVLAQTAQRNNWQRFKRIFESNALGIQETDLSELTADMEVLRKQGVRDIEAYIETHPEKLTEWLGMMHINQVNQAMLDFCEVDTHEEFLERLPEFLTPEAFETFSAETLAIWNGASSFVGRIPMVTRLGKERVLEYTCNFPKEGDYSILVYTYTDITEALNQEQTINRQVALLNQKNDDLKRYIASNLQLENFAYIASHDLQTPLRAIVGYTQVLQEALVDRLNADEQHYLAQVSKASMNMHQLIEDLLTFSRVNTRARQWSDVNPAELLQLLVDDIKAEPGHEDALIQWQTLPEHLIGDATRLRQLFQNLLTNALKFRRPDVPPLVSVRCETEGDHLHFMVRDNGIGIEPAFQERIFLLFQKLHSPAQYEGTGIGLSVCKTIVEQHGGKMWVESELGHGATFHFTLLKEPELLETSRSHLDPLTTTI